MVKNRIPQGCDQQGRHPEAAEAATEVGAEDNDPHMQAFIEDVVIAVAVFTVIFLFGLSVWGVLA